MVEKISAAEVRRKLDDILTKTAHSHHSFIVEQEGEMLAAIIPYDMFQQWQALLEDLEDLQDADQADRLLEEHPEAFMSLAEFNAALDAAEVAGELPA